MRRRRFLTLSSQTALIAWAGSQRPAFAEANGFLSSKEEQLLEAVLEVLFPLGADAPSSVDIRAKEYLLSCLVDPDIEVEDKEKLRKGLLAFERFTEKATEARYRELPIAERDKVLRDFVENHHGEKWVSLLLVYSLEALFGDPVYGVNSGEKGWKWIEHQPGFPRPPKPKWYRDKI